MKRVIFWSFILSMTAVAARGDVIPTLTSTSPIGGDFTWHYSANVTVDEEVQAGDFFTIYDFGNFVAGSNAQPVDWAFSSAPSGKNPLLVTPTDNPSILNLTWTYNGMAPINGSSPLGTFSIETNTNFLSTSDFAAEATRSGGPTAGTKVDNIGTISVPVPEMSALDAIGEAGVFFVAASIFKRKNARARTCARRVAIIASAISNRSERKHD